MYLKGLILYLQEQLLKFIQNAPCFKNMHSLNILKRLLKVLFQRVQIVDEKIAIYLLNKPSLFLV